MVDALSPNSNAHSSMKHCAITIALSISNFLDQGKHPAVKAHSHGGKPRYPYDNDYPRSRDEQSYVSRSFLRRDLDDDVTQDICSRGPNPRGPNPRGPNPRGRQTPQWPSLRELRMAALMPQPESQRQNRSVPSSDARPSTGQLPSPNSPAEQTNQPPGVVRSRHVVLPPDVQNRKRTPPKRLPPKCIPLPPGPWYPPPGPSCPLPGPSCPPPGPLCPKPSNLDDSEEGGRPLDFAECFPNRPATGSGEPMWYTPQDGRHVPLPLGQQNPCSPAPGDPPSFFQRMQSRPLDQPPPTLPLSPNCAIPSSPIHQSTVHTTPKIKCRTFARRPQSWLTNTTEPDDTCLSSAIDGSPGSGEPTWNNSSRSQENRSSPRTDSSEYSQFIPLSVGSFQEQNSTGFSGYGRQVAEPFGAEVRNCPLPDNSGFSEFNPRPARPLPRLNRTAFPAEDIRCTPQRVQRLNRSCPLPSTVERNRTASPAQYSQYVPEPAGQLIPISTPPAGGHQSANDQLSTASPAQYSQCVPEPAGQLIPISTPPAGGHQSANNQSISEMISRFLKNRPRQSRQDVAREAAENRAEQLREQNRNCPLPAISEQESQPVGEQNHSCPLTDDSEYSEFLPLSVGTFHEQNSTGISGYGRLVADPFGAENPNCPLPDDSQFIPYDRERSRAANSTQESRPYDSTRYSSSLSYDSKTREIIFDDTTVDSDGRPLEEQNRSCPLTDDAATFEERSRAATPAQDNTRYSSSLSYDSKTREIIFDDTTVDADGRPLEEQNRSCPPTDGLGHSQFIPYDRERSRAANPGLQDSSRYSSYLSYDSNTRELFEMSDTVGSDDQPIKQGNVSCPLTDNLGYSKFLPSDTGTLRERSRAANSAQDSLPFDSTRYSSSLSYDSKTREIKFDDTTVDSDGRPLEEQNRSCPLPDNSEFSEFSPYPASPSPRLNRTAYPAEDSQYVPEPVERVNRSCPLPGEHQSTNDRSFSEMSRKFSKSRKDISKELAKMRAAVCEARYGSARGLARQGAGQCSMGDESRIQDDIKFNDSEKKRKKEDHFKREVKSVAVKMGGGRSRLEVESITMSELFVPSKDCRPNKPIPRRCSVMKPVSQHTPLTGRYSASHYNLNPGLCHMPFTGLHSGSRTLAYDKCITGPLHIPKLRTHQKNITDQSRHKPNSHKNVLHCKSIKRPLFIPNPESYVKAFAVPHYNPIAGPYVGTHHTSIAESCHLAVHKRQVAGSSYPPKSDIPSHLLIPSASDTTTLLRVLVRGLKKIVESIQRSIDPPEFQEIPAEPAALNRVLVSRLLDSKQEMIDIKNEVQNVLANMRFQGVTRQNPNLKYKIDRLLDIVNNIEYESQRRNFPSTNSKQKYGNYSNGGYFQGLLGVRGNPCCCVQN